MKINQLLQAMPKGAVVLREQLAANGISAPLARHYDQAGWLRSIGHGAYVRAGDSPTWVGAIYAIQTHTTLDVHPGGRTALELSGDTHYEHLGRRRLYLYAAPGTRLPVWFKSYDWGVDVRFTATKLFLAAPDVAARQIGEVSLRISSPERAILELLDGVPGDTGFDEARLIMEGLTTLRPKLIQQLLEACTSVKAKRLFLYLAESAGHGWLRHIDQSRVNLGSGKRQIVKGGRYDAKYLITVPAESDEGNR